VNSLTVFIGRFSPFHNGHAEVLSRALLSSKKVLLLIGSAGQARSIKNPFTFQERKDMINAWYSKWCYEYNNEDAILVIEPLQDYPNNDQKWIRQVQSITAQHNTFGTKPKLTGANRDESTRYLQAFGDFFDLATVQNTKVGFSLSATSIRTSMFSGLQNWCNKVPSTTKYWLDIFMSSQDFYSLVKEYEFVENYKKSWASAPFPPIFVCVDACVVQSGHVLVVQRSGFPGNGLWALPGGFVDQKERLVDAAVRELQEETRIEMSPAQLYGSIKDKEIFDHPDRSTRGRTITTCFLFKLNDVKTLPKVKPQLSEVSNVMWITIDRAQKNTDMWYEDHHSMMCTMVDRIQS
jgi:bifunctional NMN adenylyltransferase/nudix hydrolase